MKRLSIIICLLIFTFSTVFILKSSNRQGPTIHALLNSQEYNATVIDYYDSIVYSSFTLRDKDGNDITMSCWFCDFDSFANTATKHLKKDSR